MFWFNSGNRGGYIQRQLEELERRLQRVEGRPVVQAEIVPKWPQSSKAVETDETVSYSGQTMAPRGDHKAKIIDVQTAINKRGDGITIKIRMELPYDETGEVNSIWGFIAVKTPAMAVTPLMYLLNLMMQQEKAVPVRIRYKSYEGKIYPQIDIRWDLLMTEIGVTVPEEWG